MGRRPTHTYTVFFMGAAFRHKLSFTRQTGLLPQTDCICGFFLSFSCPFFLTLPTNGAALRYGTWLGISFSFLHRQPMDTFDWEWMAGWFT